MNYLDGSKCWTKKDKEFVLSYVKDKLYLFFYKEALPRLEHPIQSLMDLTEEDLEYLKAIHFLLSKEVNEFIDEIPMILRNLSHSTQKEIIESRGAIRGRIDWGLTFKERYTRGVDPSLFMCKPASKMYDLPENQLLKFMLWKIRSLTENIDIKLPEEFFEKEEFDNWIEIISSRYFKVNNASKNVYFQNISMPRAITPKILRKADGHRNKSYKKLVKCYKLYENLFKIKNEDILKKLIEKQILEPLNNNKLFEIYVLFKIINFLNQLDGNLEVGLLKPGLDYIAQYKDKDTSICIFHQQMPSNFGKYSKYKEIFQCYDGLNVNLRRPDIVLKIETMQKKFYYIIEVKRTQKRGYIADSVYKVLGYISDFESCLDLEENPQGILVVWDGVKIKNSNWDKGFENSVVILTHDNFDKGLEKIINNFNNNEN